MRFFGYFDQASTASKESILNFAIKLSFALDLRDSTLNFMDDYKINPSFLIDPFLISLPLYRPLSIMSEVKSIFCLC